MKHLLLVLLFALPPSVQDKPFSDKPDIDGALAKSKTENRRVLIVWGSNDSDESKSLSALLGKDAALKKKLLYEYDVVRAAPSELAKKYEADTSKLPALTILAADGKVLANLAAPADTKEIVTLLTKHQAEPLKAKDVCDAALKQAKESKKRVLLHFGAPW